MYASFLLVSFNQKISFFAILSFIQDYGIKRQVNTENTTKSHREATKKNIFLMAWPQRRGGGGA